MMTPKSLDKHTTAAPGSWAAQIILALTFLTRIPVPGGHRPANLAAASKFFTGIGAVVGCIGALTGLVLTAIGLGNPVAVIGTIVTMAWLTRGLHEDGLADMADGFGGGQTRTDKLAIMRDSRTGSFGVLALIFTIALKTALLLALARYGLAWILTVIAAASASRLSFIFLMILLPPARTDGLAQSAGKPGRGDLAIAGMVAASVLVVTLGVPAAAAALLGCGLAAGAVGALAHRQISGHTGDVLGACQQISELAVFAAILLAWTHLGG